MRFMRSYGALTVLLFGAFAASAQNPGSRQTREFLQAAVESDTFERMEAYSALAESKNPDVLAFAQAMIRDHGKTNEMLLDAVARSGLKPPPVAVGASQSPFLAALQSARGSDFDKLYWTHQALAHRSALVVEQAYANSGDTPAVRQAAAAAVLIIGSHLAMAEQNARRKGSSELVIRQSSPRKTD